MSPRTPDMRDEHPSDDPVGDVQAGRTEPVLHSLAEFRELILGCCELLGARTVVEIGCEWGYLTSALADWLAERSGTVYCIEPYPSAEFRSVVQEHAATKLIAAASPAALRQAAPADVYLIDGDHNFWTVSAELEHIDTVSRAVGKLPLILLHDVGWPWGHRDIYYSPTELPADAVRPYTFELGVVPGRSDVVEGGFRSGGTFAIALEEGGSGNGVLAAVDDFVARKTDYELIVIPSVFGVAVLVPRGEPWTQAVARLVHSWADHPLLARLETNRIEMFMRLLELLDEVTRARAASHADDVELRDAHAELDRVHAELAAMRTDADSLAQSRWVRMLAVVEAPVRRIRPGLGTVHQRLRSLAHTP
jgi:Methyltransferase domain